MFQLRRRWVFWKGYLCGPIPSEQPQNPGTLHEPRCCYSTLPFLMPKSLS